MVFAATHMASAHRISVRAVLAIHAATQMVAPTTTALKAPHAVSQREFALRQAVLSVLTNISASIVVLTTCAATEGSFI